MRLRISRHVLLLFVCAVFGAGAIGWTAGAATRAYVNTIPGGGAMSRPATISVGNGQCTPYFSRLRWSSWGGRTARAKGRLTYREPDFDAGESCGSAPDIVRRVTVLLEAAPSAAGVSTTEASSRREHSAHSDLIAGTAKGDADATHPVRADDGDRHLEPSRWCNTSRVVPPADARPARQRVRNRSMPSATPRATVRR